MRRGKIDRKSGVYKTVHEHFEGIFNAGLCRLRVFQQAARTLALCLLLTACATRPHGADFEVFVVDFDFAFAELVAEVGDVALELPELLGRIREARGQVSDLEVRAPSLHAVFIHLTGRELRE